MSLLFLYYLGLQIHTLTRSKSLVNSLCNLGLSVNYRRVLELEDQLAGSVSMHFEKQGIVCPPNLRKGLFTVGALDNLDHNPSSTTSQNSFHRTAISVFQFPSVSNSGIGNGHIFFDPLSTGKCLLPDNYSHVPVVDCSVRTVNLPACSTSKNKLKSTWIQPEPNKLSR